MRGSLHLAPSTSPCTPDPKRLDCLKLLPRYLTTIRSATRRCAEQAESVQQQTRRKLRKNFHVSCISGTRAKGNETSAKKKKFGLSANLQKLVQCKTALLLLLFFPSRAGRPWPLLGRRRPAGGGPISGQPCANSATPPAIWYPSLSACLSRCLAVSGTLTPVQALAACRH